MTDFWSWFFLLTAALGTLVIVNSLWANQKTYNERMKLVRLMSPATGGDRWYECHLDFDETDYREHYSRCFWFKRRDVIYGPLIQELMLYNHLGRLEDNEFFWLCYEDVYRRKLNKRETRKVNEMIAQYGPSNLPMALEYLGHNLPEYNPPPKFVMAEAASEYDEIISMQDSVNGNNPL